MEINQNFKSVPKPTLGSIKPGDVFLVEERGLHESARVAYMRLAELSLDEAHGLEVPVVRLTDGLQCLMRVSRQVTPVKAVLTLEVPFG